MSIKALLVDLDGVIRQWPSSDNLIETRYSLPAGAIRRTAFAPDLLSLAILGRITDQEWRQKIAERLQLEFSLGSTATDAVLEWSQPIGQVDRVTLSLLQQCDTSLCRVLVTNATSRLESDLARLGIVKEFKLVVNSSTVGIAKPDPRIFEIALLRADVKATEALFIDDSAENIRAAEQLGITGHLFTGHDQLRSFLSRLGVMPREHDGFQRETNDEK